MVARFHEGCLHRRVDGIVEEFIFTEASPTAIGSWIRQIEQIMASPDCPDVALWLLDLRLSGPLPEDEVVDQLNQLNNTSGCISKELRVAYLMDMPDTFCNLLAGATLSLSQVAYYKWFVSTDVDDRREQAIKWLLAAA